MTTDELHARFDLPLTLDTPEGRVLGGSRRSDGLGVAIHQLDRLDSAARSRLLARVESVITAGRDDVSVEQADGGTVVITPALAPGTTLSGWLESLTTQPTPPVNQGSPVAGEFTRMFSARPMDGAPESPAAEQAVATQGEFTRQFSARPMVDDATASTQAGVPSAPPPSSGTPVPPVGATPQTPPAPPVTPPPVEPAASSTPESGSFTALFGAPAPPPSDDPPSTSGSEGVGASAAPAAPDAAPPAIRISLKLPTPPVSAPPLPPLPLPSLPSPPLPPLLADTSHEGAPVAAPADGKAAKSAAPEGSSEAPSGDISPDAATVIMQAFERPQPESMASSEASSAAAPPTPTAPPTISHAPPAPPVAPPTISHAPPEPPAAPPTISHAPPAPPVVPPTISHAPPALPATPPAPPAEPAGGGFTEIFGASSTPRPTPPASIPVNRPAPAADAGQNAPAGPGEFTQLFLAQSGTPSPIPPPPPSPTGGGGGGSLGGLPPLGRDSHGRGGRGDAPPPLKVKLFPDAAPPSGGESVAPPSGSATGMMRAAAGSSLGPESSPSVIVRLPSRPVEAGPTPSNAPGQSENATPQAGSPAMMSLPPLPPPSLGGLRAPGSMTPPITPPVAPHITPPHVTPPRAPAMPGLPPLPGGHATPPVAPGYPPPPRAPGLPGMGLPPMPGQPGRGPASMPGSMGPGSMAGPVIPQSAGGRPPSEFTQVMQGFQGAPGSSAAAAPGSFAALAATPAGPPKKKPSILPLIIVINVVVIAAIALVAYFILRG